MTQKITVKKCMTLYVTLCMTQNMGAIFLQKRVYDTKVYDTKCTTDIFIMTKLRIAIRLTDDKFCAGTGTSHLYNDSQLCSRL